MVFPHNMTLKEKYYSTFYANISLHNPETESLFLFFPLNNLGSQDLFWKKVTQYWFMHTIWPSKKDITFLSLARFLSITRRQRAYFFSLLQGLFIARFFYNVIYLDLTSCSSPCQNISIVPLFSDYL